MLFAGGKLAGFFVFDRLVIDRYNQVKVLEALCKKSESNFDDVIL
jgi:hypothetical protein